MKKLALIFLMLQTVFLAAADKANPADFGVKVHVISSSLRHDRTGFTPSQVLEVTIDGQPIQLTSFLLSANAVLAIGDYPARLSTNKAYANQHPNGYDIIRAYDLLFPDGHTRTFTVTRLGPAVSHP